MTHYYKVYTLFYFYYIYFMYMFKLLYVIELKSTTKDMYLNEHYIKSIKFLKFNIFNRKASGRQKAEDGYKKTRTVHKKHGFYNKHMKNKCFIIKINKKEFCLVRF